MSSAGKTALILTGGGARAAYQVGVLQALQLIRRDAGEKLRGSPFRIICGTSAGAINGMALASRADHYDLALRAMIEVWRDFRTEQVYRSDSFGVIRSGAQWLTLFSLGWALARWRRARPRSLLDPIFICNTQSFFVDPLRSPLGWVKLLSCRRSLEHRVAARGHLFRRHLRRLREETGERV